MTKIAHKMRFNISRSACLIMLVIVASCGSGEPPDNSTTPSMSGGNILRVAYERELDVLNAYTSQMLVDIIFSMVEGLITTNDRNTYIPVLAKQIPSEENGLVTRNDDGTELDVAWRAQRIKNHESTFAGIGNHFLQEDQPEHIGHAMGDWYRRNLAVDKTVWYKQPRNEMETVLHFFDAVINGDLDKALGMVHPDCTWVYRGPDSIPFVGEYKGPEGVGDYLQKFGSTVEIVEFNPEMIWNDNDIIIQASEINRLHGGDKTIELDVTQVFKVKNGWIMAFQEYSDTAKMASLFE